MACGGCGKETKPHARGLCATCYRREERATKNSLAKQMKLLADQTRILDELGVSGDDRAAVLAIICRGLKPTEMEPKASAGVYSISYTPLYSPTRQIYIGSSFDVAERWKSHRRQLRANTHHNILMQVAWNESREADWRWQILQPFDLRIQEQDLRRWEHGFIELYRKQSIALFNCEANPRETIGRYRLLLEEPPPDSFFADLANEYYLNDGGGGHKK